MPDIDIQTLDAGEEADIREALDGVLGWKLHDEWVQSTDGSATVVNFINLGGATEIFLLQRSVTKSTSGASRVYLSDDNGVSVYNTSGDYKTLEPSGAVADSGSAGDLHENNATLSRSGFMEIKNWALPLCRDARSVTRTLEAASGPINAVRVIPSSGGSFTGGFIQCYAR